LGLNLETSPFTPQALEKKLWGGYSTHALQDLHSIVTSRRMLAGLRADAAWVLARWHTARGEYALGLHYALLMRALDKKRGGEKGQVLLEVDCLNRLGRADEARRCLEEALRKLKGEPADYCLAYANVLHAAGASDAERLEWINRIFARQGFAELALLDEQSPLAIDNLRARDDVAAHDGPKVSVLMPAYNSAATIEKAIRGLLAQSWRNIEIIPVDDCSPDETWSVLQAYAEQDSRIVPIRHAVNMGAYGARLTALERATGEFITVHDADDWSHPQKIEVQVKALLEDESLVACMSSWCRASRDLYINRVGVIPGPNLQRQNESSLMFRRSLVESLGAWDRVRAGADTEYIWRIQAVYGKRAIKVVHEEVPLSFSLSQEDSLTQTGPTHVKTIFYGTRRVYREAQRWWHNSASPAALKMPLKASGRRLPAPPNLLARRPPPREYDLLLVADFTLAEGVGGYAEGLVTAALQAGYRVALFHWGRYEKPAMRPVRDAYQALAAEGRLDILAAEDALYARCALVCDPMVARHLKDRFPAWQVGALYCVAGHPQGSGFPVGVWAPGQVATHLAEAFGRPAIWVAVSSRDRELLAADANFPAVSAMTLPEPPLAASALVEPLKRLVQAAPKAPAVSESAFIFKRSRCDATTD
jgi:tetratricopeptide (TPR) repeat protein